MLQINSKNDLQRLHWKRLQSLHINNRFPKSEIENIRGVNCDYSIQKLLEKDLITIQGKGDGPGNRFYMVLAAHSWIIFGLKSAKDLPKLKDVILDENEIGTPADMQYAESDNAEDISITIGNTGRQ